MIGEYINVLAYGAEFFVKALNHGKVRKERRFGDHTARLVADGVIDAALKGRGRLAMARAYARTP